MSVLKNSMHIHIVIGKLKNKAGGLTSRNYALNNCPFSSIVDAINKIVRKSKIDPDLKMEE
jgi:hypothetical protein